jgi:hypothetical protein
LTDSGNSADNLAVPTYPTFPTLTRKPALRTKTSTFDPTLRDTMENGMETTRARYTRRRRKWSVSIDMMTNADWNTLEAFVQQDAVYGALPFHFFDTRQPAGNQIAFDPNGTIVLPHGHATKVQSSPLGSRNWGAIWSDFSLVSELPADALITAIYPVIIASAVFDICLQYLAYGPVAEAGLGGGLLGNQFDNPAAPNATFSSTEFTSLHSFGTSLSALAGQKIGFAIDSSLGPYTGLTDEMDVTGVGFALYYTSATPTTDPLMPAPVTVTAGQGVAWALPFGVDLLGDGSAEGTSEATLPSGGRYTPVNNRDLLVRFEVIPSYTDAGWVESEFRQNCTFEIGEV